MIKVAILAYDGLAIFEFSCAIEIFGLKRPEFKDWYQTEVVSVDKPLVTGTCNVPVGATVIDNFDGFDLLIIPGWQVGGEDAFAQHQKLIDCVKSFHQQGGRVLSLCSGAFLLAEAGLFANRQATTHWLYAEKFKRRYPEVSFVENVLYLYDGQVGCSAGSASALDLGLEVVREDFGHDKANQVARRLVIAPHRSGGQAQFVETPVAANQQSQFASTLDWAIKRLNSPLDVDTLAKKSNMSRRTFDRHFRAALGMSAKEWIIRQRLHLAQKILEDKAISMENVAQKSGFETAMNMRHHFNRIFGVSPSYYQSQFLRKSDLETQL